MSQIRIGHISVVQGKWIGYWGEVLDLTFRHIIPRRWRPTKKWARRAAEAGYHQYYWMR